MDDQIKNKMEQAYNLIEQAHHQMTDVWLEHVLFGWQWWLGVFLSVIPWLLWVLLRDKQKAVHSLLVGFFVITISSWLDLIGISLGLWHYNWEVLPFIPANIPWNFSLIPVTIMLFLQYRPTVSPLIKAAVFGGFTAFVAEPLAQWVDLYEPEQWRHIYSFLIYIFIYMTAYSLYSLKKSRASDK
ncbi:MAG TPA: CBO0543 family protein [Bacilli bacterium]